MKSLDSKRRTSLLGWAMAIGTLALGSTTVLVAYAAAPAPAKAPAHVVKAPPADAKALTTDPNVASEIKWDDLIPTGWRPPRMPRMLGIFGDSTPEAEDALASMRAAWDSAPTVDDMNGRLVKLPGYLVPLEEVRGELKEFLLVPYFGACIHTPPPPANQIVFVVPKTAAKGFRAMDTVWVSGRLSTTRQASYMGASGYRLDATSVELYVAPSQTR